MEFLSPLTVSTCTWVYLHKCLSWDSKQLSRSVVQSTGISALYGCCSCTGHIQPPSSPSLAKLRWVGQGLTSAFPKVYNVSKILWWSRYSIHGPVSPDSRSFSSWTSMSNICSRWDGMFVSVTGALSSKRQKNHKYSKNFLHFLCAAALPSFPIPTPTETSEPHMWGVATCGYLC